MSEGRGAARSLAPEGEDAGARGRWMEAEVIAAQRYSEAEKVRFRRVIREFNEVYYELSSQTWGSVRYREIPVRKAPTDLWVYQELVSRLRPDLIVETGSFQGGSALFLRDMLQVNGIPGWVISIDGDMSSLDPRAEVAGIKFLKESSVSSEAVAFVKAHIAAYQSQRVMIILDSGREEGHVLRELLFYAPLVTVGSALIIEETSHHGGPRAAVEQWFEDHESRGYRYVPDTMCEKYLLTFNRDGYFERVM